MRLPHAVDMLSAIYTVRTTVAIQFTIAERLNAEPPVIGKGGWHRRIQWGNAYCVEAVWCLSSMNKLEPFANV